MVRNNNYSLALYEKAIPAGYSFPEMLKTAYDCGFDRLEISIDETDARLARLDWSENDIIGLGRLSREENVPVTTMCLSGHRKYPFGSHSPQVREKSMDIMKKAVDFCGLSGIRIIQLAGYDVYYEEHDEETERRFAENLSLASEYAARNGIVLAFETMETPFMDTVQKAMKYVSSVGSAWLGVYPDIGNLMNAAVKYGHSITGDLAAGSGHIFAAHLKETVPGVYRDMRFGEGHTPYKQCLDVLKAQGVRMFTGEFWYQKGQDHIEEISRSAAFLRNELDSVFTD